MGRPHLSFSSPDPPAPNHPAWMRNYLRNGFLETRTSPFGRRNRQVGSQGHIASGNFGCSRQPLFGFKWAECDVFIDVTSPFNVCRSPGTFHHPQTLPITCSIRSAGLHSLCNRKNWRAYSTTPSLRMGAIFAQFYSWDRRRIHKLTFIFADNPSLWDFKVRGAIAFDVPSNLLFITFWYHFCNRTMEHRSIALVRLFTEIATTKFIVLGRGVLPW